MIKMEEMEDINCLEAALYFSLNFFDYSKSIFCSSIFKAWLLKKHTV